tara:strand:- start:1280 stop:1606 length:327 start_codon:yes stop_codon:yes gene_type:complete
MPSASQSALVRNYARLVLEHGCTWQRVSNTTAFEALENEQNPAPDPRKRTYLAGGLPTKELTFLATTTAFDGLPPVRGESLKDVDNNRTLSITDQPQLDGPYWIVKVA